MVLDIIVAIIVLTAMVLGFRKGFAHTFLHTIDWILALVAAVIWSSKLGELIMEKTDFYTTLYNKVEAKFTESFSNATAGFDSLPRIFGDAIDNATSKMAAEMAQTMTDRIFSIICFVLMVLLVKLVIWLIIAVIAKKDEDDDSLIGFTDGLAGMLVGFLKGMIITFVVLALMMPVLNMFSPEKIEFVMKSMENSYFAGDLYENNFLLLIVRDFMHIGG